ncbi:UNVERIFIED_CONTAM: Beta-galactosidase 8 [Sesamum latifolium]|uniref:beta-galactosidase n=1 Tax=Sesamum latifolium TaxID=2727402 RepID=A0AAW2Y4I1_9LAMI
MRGGGAVAATVVFLQFLLWALTLPSCFGGNVRHDHRGLVIAGKRRVLVSGSIHYMRSTPQMWPDLLQKSKDGGLDVIQTFVFWNLHEPVRGQAEMRRFTAKIVNMMKQENLYASQGGPIILSQYHGGTNFGRTSGGPFITTSYDYDSPIDEYGLLRQPKWGHLKDVHKAIKLCEAALVARDPETTSLGSNLEATVYKTESGVCAAFLANVDSRSEATVNFNGNSYHLPAWSVSILPDCKTVVLNTAKNYGAYFDKKGAGVTGPVQLKGLRNGSTVDLSSQQWTYQIGLRGEELALSSGTSSLWVSQPTLPKDQPLVWYKAWINGQSIGRYWPKYTAPDSGCTDSCNYRGSFSPSKLYLVAIMFPRSWLQASENVLVLFEEMGGDPEQISLATRETGSICSHILETHPMEVDMWTTDEETRTRAGPTLSLDCPFPNQVISEIKFASFGTPHGTCGSFSHGRCSSEKALSIVQKVIVLTDSVDMIV